MTATEKFGYEWKKYHQIIPEYEEQFLKWVTPLKPQHFKNKSILDAGCGTGRNSYWPLIYGAKEVLAFDFDPRTVAVARKNLAKFKNVKVCFGNIYQISQKNKFDIAHAIGVIPHLRNPELAVLQLVKATKKGGKVILWLLGAEGNKWLIVIGSLIRVVTSRLPLFLVDWLSLVLTIPLYAFIKLALVDHPYLKQISKYKFFHIRSIVFDHLIFEVVHYWTFQEAIALLKKCGLKNVKASRINLNSWTVIGSVPGRHSSALPEDQKLS